MVVVSFKIEQKNIDEVLAKNQDCKFFHVEHTEDFQNDDQNLITLSRKDNHAKSILIALTNRGFYLYMVKHRNVSSFVKHTNMPNFWEPIKKQIFNYDNGLVYSLDKPKVDKDVKLLVIFSSISGKMYQSSIHRYFERNFKTIEKYISPNTAILRIADLGGVTGAYYLNTNYEPANELKIQNLIFQVEQKLNTKKTVLFGVSKGGTGALYHGNLGNYSFLAVDPIVNDTHYLKKYNDLHFVENIFPASKSEKINDLLKKNTYSKKNTGCIITSTRSPQFYYINEQVLLSNKQNFCFFITDHPEIKDHPDVAPNSIHMITTLINNLINDIYLERTVTYFL